MLTALFQIKELKEFDQIKDIAYTTPETNSL